MPTSETVYHSKREERLTTTVISLHWQHWGLCLPNPKAHPGLEIYKGKPKPSPHFGGHPLSFQVPKGTNLILTAAVWILRLNSKCESSALCFSAERNKLNTKSQRNKAALSGKPQLGQLLSPQSLDQFSYSLARFWVSLG